MPLNFAKLYLISHIIKFYHNSNAKYYLLEYLFKKNILTFNLIYFNFI